MGKKGDALRAAKLAQVRTFTNAELMEHDRIVARNAVHRVEKELMAKVKAEYDAKNAELEKNVEENWARKEKAFAENHPNDNVVSVISLLMATSCRVLIEKFGWKPIPKDGAYDHRNRMMKFSDCLTDEVLKATENGAAILDYCEETYDLYGVRFQVFNKEEEDGNTEELGER